MVLLDKGHKLDVHKTFSTSPERHMYVQFTSCVQEVITSKSRLQRSPNPIEIRKSNVTS